MEKVKTRTEQDFKGRFSEEEPDRSSRHAKEGKETLL
jgi:hypothetical protein